MVEMEKSVQIKIHSGFNYQIIISTLKESHLHAKSRIFTLLWLVDF